MNQPINLKFSKLDNHPIKTYRNINYRKNLINDEDVTENDINSTYKNEFTNKNISINNTNINMTKSKKIFNDDDLYNRFRKNYNKNEDKKVSNNNNSNSNVINNYILKNFYRKEEDKTDNSSEDINLDKKNQSHIPNTCRFKPHENNQLFSNIANKNNFNSSKQVNKSNSYFKDNKYINQVKNADFNNHNNFSIHQISINPYNKINGKNLNNFNNNPGKINKSFIPYTGKNKRIFKSKIYSNMENYKQDIGFTDKDSFDSLNIDDLINKVNYTGDKNGFYRYLEELKLKADITTIVQNMFKSEINSYNGLEKYLENNTQAKNKKILEMYKFLFEKLIQKNQNKINDKLIDKFYDEIYSCQ